MAIPPSLERLPLIGRSEELTRWRLLLQRLSSANGGGLCVAGSAGVGKSRLVHAFLEEARLRGYAAVKGQAYAAERDVPFAPVSDAFGPLLRSLTDDQRRVVVNGIEREVEYLFPMSLGRLGSAVKSRVESSAQLLWAMVELAGRIAAQRPLVVAIDDVQWADTASRELLHFLIRHTADQRVAVVLTANESEPDAAELIAGLDRSLGRDGLMEMLRVDPLTEANTRDMVCAAFRVDRSVSGSFAVELHARTRGNAFFIEEILKTLVMSGALSQRGGTWTGWDTLRLDPPPTVRDAVRLRCGALSTAAQETAELIAVFGTRVRYAVLQSVTSLPEEGLIAVLDELCRLKLIEETVIESEPVYDVQHPLVRDVLYDDVGFARRRMLHARIAEKLEEAYGSGADDHANELARHFLRGGIHRDARTIRYLHAAGRAALRRHAYDAAISYLEAAVDAVSTENPMRIALLEDLARARLRNGDLDPALELLARARAAALECGDDAAVARLWWRTGLAQFWSGTEDAAIASYDAGLASIPSAAPTAQAARIQLARAIALHALGRVRDAELALEDAAGRAEQSRDPALQARVNRALLQLNIWTGSPARAREHGERALTLARTAGDEYLECTVHWALGVLHGMTGNATGTLRAIHDGGRLAEKVRSPFLGVASLELLIEYSYGSGDWDTGLAVGERAIELARNLQLRALLPRVLVWTALIYTGRDELDTAAAYIGEAARLARADDHDAARDIHSLVPVAIGRACLHLARGEYEQAVEAGKQGLAVVDHTAFRAWTVHRLLPFIAEAYLQMHRVEECRPFARRLRREAGSLQHELGLAWADAADGLMQWLNGDPVRGAALMLGAAERLEAVPYVYDAARVRRQIAGRLADAGDRDGAIRELRRVHDVFARLGAKRELEKVRGQFREVDARPQPRTSIRGAGNLTERELAVVRLVVANSEISNKAIAARLGISTRTVGTHLNNIYRKLGVESRDALASRAGSLLV